MSVLLKTFVSAGSSGPTAADGSASYPYQATGATAGDVITALNAITAGNDEYAMATITGQPSIAMRYNAADDAWYGADGGNGSELAPYWTTLTDDDGIDDLPLAVSGDYGVIGKGTGTPGSFRGLQLVPGTSLTASILPTAGGVLPVGGIVRWVEPLIYARGAPSSCTFMSRSIEQWTRTGSGGSQFDYNSTTANRVTVRSGTAAAEDVTSSVAKSTSSALAMIFRRVAVAGASIVSGTIGYARVNTSSDSNQSLLIAYGGTSLANATNYFMSAGTPADTGIALAGEKPLAFIRDISTDAVTGYDGGVAAYSGTVSSSTTVFANLAEIKAQVQNGGQTTWTFTEAFFCEWD